MSQPLLRVKNFTKSYYGVTAVDDVSFDVSMDGITGLIGPNGSGKSTLFDCLTGMTKTDSGQVIFGIDDISGMRPEQIAQTKLIRTFQNLTVFPDLTLIDNMRVVAQAHSGVDILTEILGGRRIRASEAQATELADMLLDEIELTHMRDRKAGEMSYGQQKLLVMGMAMMAKPRLILFDEPVAGVNPALIEKIKGHIRRWNGEGVGFFIIEHNLRLITDLCSDVLVLERGKILMRGDPQSVVEDPRVIEAYLGGEFVNE